MGFGDFSLSGLQGGDAGIFQTVTKIKDAIYYALREPNQRIRRRAEDLIRSVPERNEQGEVLAIGQFVKNHFHFAHDPQGIEFVKSPEVSDKEIDDYGEFIGDCDDASAYLAALLKSVGYQTNLTIIAKPMSAKNNFTHIFVQVYLPKFKKWLPLDMTARRKPLGWMAPHGRIENFLV